jgi:hypothetical protein
VLSEVVFGGAQATRTFMCGALSERLAPDEELAFARGKPGRAAIRVFGRDRVLLTPDCGFATFADNPVSSSSTAESKLRTISQAAAILRAEFGL